MHAELQLEVVSPVECKRIKAQGCETRFVLPTWRLQLHGGWTQLFQSSGLSEEQPSCWKA